MGKRQAPALSRRDFGRLRRRAWELAQASYRAHLATLVEIVEARGLDEALEYFPHAGAPGTLGVNGETGVADG